MTPTTTRRGLITKAAAAAPLVAVGSGMVPLSRFFPAAWADQPPGDYDLAGFAQSIELALVKLYGTASSKLSGPQAEMASDFLEHHNKHADAFASFFEAAQATPPGAENSKLMLDFQSKVAAGGNGTLSALQQLEELVAATYFWIVGRFVNQSGSQTFSSILAVEGQHAVSLGLLTGGDAKSLVPGFQTEDKKVTPAQYPTPPPKPGASSSGSGSSGAGSGSSGAGS